MEEANGYDPVDKPEHYAKGYDGFALECIDWIRMELTQEEYHGYLKGNIMKYLWRHEDKGNPIQDLQKLRKYAEMLIDQFEREKEQAEIDDENRRIEEWLEERRSEKTEDRR